MISASDQQTKSEVSINASPANRNRLVFNECHELDRRHIWATIRAWMEADRFKRTRDRKKRRHHWKSFESLVRAFGAGLKICGLYERGVRNALDIQLHHMTLSFEHLPDAFDGYTILHLTDLHFNALEGLEDTIVDIVSELEVDFCAFTGDYRVQMHGSYAKSVSAMQRVINSMTARDGIVATLGNHDTIHMVNAFEGMGIRVLGNETVCIQRNGSTIYLTGIDDVHCYYTDMVLEALEASPESFKIALVHSPEIYDLVADHGYALYLAGHTHAGQITLPNGGPIIKHLKHGKHLGAGLWQHQGMIGYTSSGAGVSGLPVRYNTRGEISLITLKKKLRS